MGVGFIRRSSPPKNLVLEADAAGAFPELGAFTGERTGRLSVAPPVRELLLLEIILTSDHSFWWILPSLRVVTRLTHTSGIGFYHSVECLTSDWKFLANSYLFQLCSEQFLSCFVTSA